MWNDGVLCLDAINRVLSLGMKIAKRYKNTCNFVTVGLQNFKNSKNSI